MNGQIEIYNLELVRGRVQLHYCQTLSPGSTFCLLIKVKSNILKSKASHHNRKFLLNANEEPGSKSQKLGLTLDFWIPLRSLPAQYFLLISPMNGEESRGSI